jgi:hypothetical protein
VRPGTLRAAIAAALVAIASLGCGSPTPSQDFTGSCATDGKAPGAYPDLERVVSEQWGQVSPDAFASIPPTTVDSGRNCTPASLGTLAAHGVKEVRFAGATWDRGNGNATVRVILRAPAGAPPLQGPWVEEFYEAGARASSKTENIEITRPSMDGAGPVYRIDTLNNLSLQTVLVWPSDDGVRVALVSTTVDPGASRAEHERRVSEAVQTHIVQPSG